MKKTWNTLSLASMTVRMTVPISKAQFADRIRLFVSRKFPLGHGGSEAATFAKEHLINLIVNQKSFWSNDDRDILRAIREGYIATHYAMWREQGKYH